MRAWGSFKCSCLITLFILSGGCSVSFSSSQYEFVRDLILQPSSTLLEKTWVVSFDNEQIPLFAIKSGSGAVFTDGGDVLIYFDGWHIRRVSGLGDTMSDLEIQVVDTLDGAEIAFYPRPNNGSYREKHKCGAWGRVTSGKIDRGDTATWRQSCAGNLAAYNNEIGLDEFGQVSTIKFATGIDGQTIQLRRTN
jgi:hypothetical protein